MAANIEAVAEAMYKMVAEVAGTKRYKPGDLTKAMVKQFADDGLTKSDAKEALKILVDSERVVYSYFNGTFIEMPKVEGAAK